jgi:chromosome segregation ATPase
MDESSVSHLERLLSAVYRLRNERDGLRQDLEFLQTENTFTIQALEARIKELTESDNVSSPATSESDYDSRAVISPLRKYLKSVVLQNDVFAIVCQNIASESERRELACIDLEVKLHEVESSLRIAEQSLEEASEQRHDLVSRLESKECELNGVRAQCQEANGVIEHLEGCLSDANKASQALESERGSLTLEVTNLSNDLDRLKKELAEAEARYSELQFCQLSAMTSSEATRVLKQQIETLEMRVMRRTEQIGIHQHDIRRLETNLKLQEERLVEMTLELETLAAQKDAMVEDCADARDARDDALAKVEKMEVEVESMETEIEKMGAEVEKKDTDMVGLKKELDHQDASIQTLVSVLMQTVARGRDAFRVAKARTQSATSVEQRLNAELHTSQRRIAEETQLRQKAEAATTHTRDLVVALAVSQSDYAKQSANRRSLASANEALHNTVTTLKARLDAKCSEIQDLVAQISSLRSSKSSEAEGNLVEEVGALQSRLVEVSSALEETDARCSSMEERYSDLLAESSAAKADLEEQLKKSAEDSYEQRHTAEQLRRTNVEQQAILTEMETRIATLEAKLKLAEELQNDLEHNHEASMAEQVATQTQYQEHIRSLDLDLAALQAELEEERKNYLSLLSAADQSRAQLVEAEANWKHEKEAYKQKIYELQQNAETEVAKLKQELSAIEAEVKASKNEVATLQVEQTTLQQDNTALEGEHQRLLSLTRYLEAQVKELWVILR